MATGERRLGSSARRGMTVLGKIPAVPKPINLPSQRLENRGLDPSVEIVPRGTFSWGTGRSPPASGSPWGNVGLSSSPPISTGAWNSASTSVQPVAGSNSITGTLAQTPPRPLSAGSMRPLSAGTTRPSSASVTSGRAWGGAAKLEEQLQPSRFNLTTVEFPTLGSEKNPILRPQQNTASSNRPTSADATKERHAVYTGTSFSRPTSADGSKERKSGYPGVAPSDRPTSADGTLVDRGRHHSGVAPPDRPTSADGTLVDRGRHQSDVRLRTFPAFADGNLSDQKQPVYTGVGHGTAGPGPGTHVQVKDGHSLYPPLVQQGIASPGSHMLPVGEIMYPGASQHDQYFNRHQALRSNMGERDVLVLPMDTRPGMYGSYPSDLGPNHLDRSRVYQSSRHPQSSWEPNNFDRSRVYQSHHFQSGPSEHPPHGMVQIEPRTFGMDNAMQHEQPVVGTRRDGYNTTNKDFGEQRGGWAGRNVVYTGSHVDAREPSISTSGTGRELQKPDIFVSSWGHQPTHSGWGNVYNVDTSMGMYKGGALSATYKQAPSQEKMPQGSVLKWRSENRHMEESQGKGAGHVGEAPHPVSSQGSAGHANQGDIQLDNSVFPLGASVTGKASKVPGPGVTEISNSIRQDVQIHKQEETTRSLTSKTAIGGPQFLERGKNALDNGNPSGGSDIWPPGSGASGGTQPSTTKQEEEVSRTERSREPQRTEFVSKVAIQRQQDNCHDNLEGKNNVHMVDKDSTIADTTKSTIAKKKYPVSQRFSKGKKKDDVLPSPLHESEETTCASKTPLSKASDGNRVNGSTLSSAVFSTSPSKECNSDVFSGVPDTAKHASADTCSNGAHATVQAKSSTHARFERYSAGDHLAMPTPEPTFSVTPVETVTVSSSEDGEQAPKVNSLNMKTRQNAYPSRRPHYSRSTHESNAADKHVSHGMIWAPVKNSTTVGAAKEENQPHIGNAGTMHESSQKISTEVNQEKPMQPLQEHQPKESQGQRHAQQVQQMQSAASSQQGQGHQMQEHSVVSIEMQVQQMHHQKAEFNSKRQGQRTQHQRPRSSAHREPEQWTQQEQFVAKNQTKQHQSVVPSYLEQGQLQSHCASSSQREVHGKEILPAKDQHAESRPVPVADRFEGIKKKDESTIYPVKPDRNQQHQRLEQEYDHKASSSSHHGQRFVNKGDRIVVEDPSETSTLPVIEPKDEVKSHSSRTLKHQKRRQHESSASQNAGDRHVSMLEPSLFAEPEAIKHEAESRTYNRKLVRQQEMQNKQSAAVSRHEINQIGEEHRKPFVQTPDSTSCGSTTIKNERKFYVPKQAKQQYMHQQECATSGYQGQKSREQTSQEAHLSNEKVQNYAESSPLSGVESNVTQSSVKSTVRKDDIELYTPKPARQQHMQGHQLPARGQRSQRIVNSTEGQCGQDATSSSTQAGIESALNKDKEITGHDHVSDSMGNKGIAQSSVAGNRDESKLHVSSQFSQSKKEVKYYAPKPGKQQHSQEQQSVVMNIDQAHVEVPMREGTHQMSGTKQSKRKDEIKLYKPRPREQKSTEGKVVKESEELSSAEEKEQQRTGNDERASEFEHGYRNRNHSSRPHKSALFPRSQMNTQPSIEDGTVEGHVSRVDDTREEVISKENSKNRESGFHQKIEGSRQRHHNAGTLEEADVFKTKQYQKRQYHYQPVAHQPQTVKPREEEFNVDYEHKFSARQPDQGQNRYERREGPRGRFHGYGYRAADHTG